MSIRLEWEDLASARVRVAPRHVFVDDAPGLSRVLDPAMNLCIWRRSIGTTLAAWLQRVGQARSFHAQRDIVPSAPDATALVEALPAGPERDALRADIERLARAYGELLEAPSVLATFARVDHDMCRRFHVDSVGIRGLCTYAGAGTQWVAEHAALRGGLGRQGSSLSASNLAVVPNPGEVQSLEVGWVAFLKGSAWPGNREFGAIHRSPPVSETGEPRILLKLDVDPTNRLRV